MFLSSARLIFACALVLAALIALSCCSVCNLNYIYNAPIIQRHFGNVKYYRNYPYRDSNERGSIPLSNGEIISAFCAKSFHVHTDYYNQFRKEIKANQLTFKCNGKILEILIPKGNDDISGTDRFSCTSLEYNLFESNETLPGCSGYKAYSISPKSMPELNYTSIALCFNWKTLNIKYAKYISYQSADYFVEKNSATLPAIIEADTEIVNFESVFGDEFMSQSSFTNLYERKRAAHTLLEPHKYVYETLLQDAKAGQRYKTFDKIFNIVWWQDLLKRNWRLFLNEFVERNQEVTYMIYTGVSGILTLPKNDEILEVRDKGKSVKAPAHIWFYLKSVDANVEDEFVIVAHNSPFLKSNGCIQMCEDICHKIDWLRNSTFIELHLMPVYGVINCCRYEDVYDILDNFPVKSEKLIKNEQQISTESISNAQN